MATKKLACYGNELVIIEDKRIVDRIVISEDALYKSIDKAIENGINAPSLVFKAAVEDILGIEFFNPRQVLMIEGKRVSIHDQTIYKKYYPYIMENKILKRKRKSDQERRDARREYYENNKQIEGFFQEHSISVYKRAIRCQTIKY